MRFDRWVLTALFASAPQVSVHAQQSVSWFTSVPGAYHEEPIGLHAHPNGDSTCVAMSYLVGPVGQPTINQLFQFQLTSSGGLSWSTVQPDPDQLIPRASSRNPATGYVHIAGIRIGAGTTDHDIFTTVYDASGSLVWTADFNGPQGIWDDACAVFADAAGCTYVAGMVGQDGNQTAPSDLVALKYSPTGQLLWSRTIDNVTNSIDWANSAALAPNGDLIVVGYAGPFFSLHPIGARIAPDGTLLWQREWEVGPAPAIPHCVAIDADGGIFVVGETVEQSSGRAFAQALDPGGAVLWTTILTGPPTVFSDQAQLMAIHPEGGLVLGATRALSGQPVHALTARLDASGAVLWQRTYGSSAPLGFQILGEHADVNGRVILFGFPPYATPGEIEAHVVQYDADGTDLWDATLPRGFRPIHVARNTAGALLVAGWFQTAVGLDAAVLALDGQVHAYCPGDASIASCPCANDSAPGMQRGCLNSIGSAAQLLESGNASLQNDTLELASHGELANTLTIFLQGSTALNLPFGDGRRCTGGALKRLYVTHAVAGVARAPAAGEPGVSQRSAVLGDTLAPGSRRYLQAYYRDPDLTFCPAPAGNSWNISSGLIVDWLP